MKATIATVALLLLTSPVLAQDQQTGGHIITNWDVDGDGEVGLEEFTARSEAWMALLDRNADSSVTTADFGRT